MTDFFAPETKSELHQRIGTLEPSTPALWGKMDVAQMLAHNSITFELALTDKHPRPNPLMRVMLKTFVKPIVVGPKPYPKNSRTAPVFVVADQRTFDTEKQRLLDYIDQAHGLGRQHFEGLPSPSFGKLTSSEWSTLFYKHLDHHLKQFGA